MLTAGIDLASQPERTGACVIEWAAGSAKVNHLVSSGVDNDEFLRLLGSVDKLGVDVPLGWPTCFIDAVNSSRDQRLWSDVPLTSLRYRLTDLHVQRSTGHWPLSVSSDRIAIPALRAAALLGGLPGPVDKMGGGTVVEVYPAAALRRWDFAPLRYKRAIGIESRRQLVEEFRARTASWLHLEPGQWQIAILSDDAFDALVSALVARASAMALCDPCPSEDREVAAQEGWIALPTSGTLNRLA